MVCVRLKICVYDDYGNGGMTSISSGGGGGSSITELSTAGGGDGSMKVSKVAAAVVVEA